jgi:SAM-dependent methyltransferase
LFLPLQSAELKGQQTRRLARELIREIRGDATPAAEAKDEQSPETLLGKLPVEFHVMDATVMKFQDGEFDLVLSRSAMEHIQPIEAVLREMVRVVRPGGMIYLGIDPFFWVRGCHKRAVVDIPWAHARMDIEDFTRFVEQHETSDIAAKRRRRIETLNRFTVKTWRTLVEAMQCKLLDWQERPSLLGEQLLQDYSGVTKTLLPGISQRDLLCERIEVWLRRE